LVGPSDLVRLRYVVATVHLAETARLFDVTLSPNAQDLPGGATLQ
jgi:hypothetical protein